MGLYWWSRVLFYTKLNAFFLLYLYSMFQLIRCYHWIKSKSILDFYSGVNQFCAIKTVYRKHLISVNCLFLIQKISEKTWGKPWYYTFYLWHFHQKKNRCFLVWNKLSRQNCCCFIQVSTFKGWNKDKQSHLSSSFAPGLWFVKPIYSFGLYVELHQ